MKLKLISLTLFSCVIMPTTCVLAQADSSLFAVQSVQNIRKLSLREIFSLADKNNKDLKVLSSQIESTNEDISSVKQMLLPDISTTASVSYLGNGRIWDRDFTNSLTAEIPHFGNNFSLQVNQIIFAGGSIMSAVRQAELGKQISMTMQQQIKSGIHFLLAGYYLDIIKIDNRIKIYDENIALTDKLIKQTQIRMEQGYALENDVLRYELQKANYVLAKQRLESNREIINVKLNKAAGLDLNTVIKTSEIDNGEFSVPDNILQSENMASAHSYEVLMSDIALKQAQEGVKQTQSNYLPKVFLTAQEHLDGPITIEVPAIDKNFNYWFVGLGVSYDISQIYKNKAAKQKAKNNLYQSQINNDIAKDNVLIAVKEDYINYQQSLGEVSVLEKSAELSEKNYNTIYARYNNGLSLVTDMLDAANQKLSAELDLANAQINVLSAKIKLKYTSGGL